MSEKAETAATKCVVVVVDARTDGKVDRSEVEQAVLGRLLPGSESPYFIIIL